MKKQLVSVAIAAIMTAAIYAPVTASADKWVNTQNGYVYKYDDGTTASKGWLTINGNKYYIQKDSTRKTGWLTTSSGAKYYFDKDGIMQKGRWLTMKSGAKYYLRSNGKVATGVVKIGDTEYKFDTDGIYLGENHHFILNTDTSCLHSDKKCRAAQKIDKENYSEIDIGSEEFISYSKDGYWACGVSGCNTKDTKTALPKPKK